MKFRFGVDVDSVLLPKLDDFAGKIDCAVQKNKKSSKLLDSISSLMATLVDDSDKKGMLLFVCVIVIA